MEIRKVDAQSYNISENTVYAIHQKLMGTYTIHWHNFFEIEYILKGSGTHIFNGEASEFSEGSVFLLTPNDFHEIICDGPAEGLNIKFFPSMVREKVLWRISNPLNRYSGTLNAESSQEFYHLSKALCVNKTQDVEFKKNILDAILKLLLENCETSGKKHGVYFSNSAVDKAKLYMTLYFRNNPSLDDISRYVGLTTNYFCRIFMKETKQTPMNYINELKLKYAKTLILTTSLPITEIAFTCGYGSISNFLKAFKRFYNISPMQLRK